MGATDETIEALKEAQQSPSEELAKGTFTSQGWSQGDGVATGSGLVHYDLEAPAKKLYPVITPLRNMIPRVAGDGGVATNWKAITAVNTTSMHMGVGEAARSGVITNTVKEYTASYKGLGLESFCTFESEYAGQNFDDVRARAVESLLRSFFIGEEQIILGGNSSVALGTPATPTLATFTPSSASTLANSSYTVQVVALTHDGQYRSSVAGGVPATADRTPGDGGSAVTFNGGASNASLAATVTPAANDAIYATTAPIRGAFAYAWYWTNQTSSQVVLGAITPTSSVVITGEPTGTQEITEHASDHSTDDKVFDGILTQISEANSGSYYMDLANQSAAAAEADFNAGKTVGTKLEGDGAGGIKQIDDALQSFWDNYRLSPDMMIVSAQELKNMTHLLIKSGGANLFQFNVGGTDGTVDGRTIAAGTVIGSYLNKFTMAGGQMVRVMLHPNLAPGTILFFSTSIPYPLSNVNNVLQIKARRTYYQIEWPLRTRRYEFGVYADELLQNYFPPAFGVITNIADGVVTA